MRLHRSVLSVLLAAAVLTPLTGQARPPVVESGALTLQHAPAQNDYIIDGAEWTCSGVTCQAATVPDLPTLRSCKRVVAVMGAVAQFSYRGTELTADALSQCNAKAKA